MKSIATIAVLLSASVCYGQEFDHPVMGFAGITESQLNFVVESEPVAAPVPEPVYRVTPEARELIGEHDFDVRAYDGWYKDGDELTVTSSATVTKALSARCI